MLGCEQRLQGGIQRRCLQRIEAQGTVRVNHMMGDVATDNRSLGLLNGLLAPDHRVQVRGHADRGQRIHRPTLRVSRLLRWLPSNCRLNPWQLSWIWLA